MKKALSWLTDHILFLETLFLLLFIPLFPKLPILDIKNTWVSIRTEDFVVFFVALTWVVLLFKKKVTLKTPLTLPILSFWLIGAIATLHGVLLVFPTLANVFPNVAFLSMVRHIEYMSLFFIAFLSIKDKRQLPVVIGAVVAGLIGVTIYGFGQKYLDFPAYLTMNEEFAKGIPIHLSQLSRLPSTFGGHYDLAAYLVLVIPILISLVFGIKNWFVKLFLLGVSFFGFILLFYTVSRVSFFVLFISLIIVVFFQKKKLLLLSIPFALLLGLAFITSQSSLFDRFKSTVSETDVIVDAKTGESLGHVKFVDKEYFRDKTVLQRRVGNKVELAQAILGQDPAEVYSTSSAILPFRYIPPQVPLLNNINISTGENLPQGSSYLNLYLSPVVKRVGNFYYELPPEVDLKATVAAQFLVLHGDFIIKRASAYDLSFTTRFQGEWPRAVDALKRNILVGSGYGSVSLAVDNNYLRVLGEIGLLGFVSFFLIFLSIGIYIKKVYPLIDSKLAKSFVLGFGAGVIGLALNATLIDVFEASKIAFLLWTLSGITLGLLTLYQKDEIDLWKEIRKALVSTYAIIIYLFILCIILFSPMINNYFVGDDFTWLRWAADCGNNCHPLSQIASYFSSSDGFFFRPGTKIYFLLMYKAVWLNQVMYHLVSIFLHFGVASLFFLLAKRILKNRLLATSAAFLFLIMSGSLENVFWISSTGHLFNAFFGLLGLLFFIKWEEKKKIYYFAASIGSFSLALLFHELGVVFPLLVLAYSVKDKTWQETKELVKRKDFLLLFVPVIAYLLLRFMASSHWFNGDYSYDLLKFPFNFIGNTFGYVFLTLVGPIFLSAYETIRTILRDSLPLALLLGAGVLGASYLLFRSVRKAFSSSEQKTILFGLLFFIICLIPFIGLGNITSRYSYMASLGIILIFVLFVKKIYFYLLSSGKETALGVVTVIVIVFGLFHVIQAQQTYFQWTEAGNKAKNFFISIEDSYINEWSRDDVQFHFVNVPIKIGEAWVFPVGLNDAVWFAFRNSHARVFFHPDLKSALQSAGSSKTSHILIFTPDGRVKEYDRFRKYQDDLIMPQQ